MKSEWATIFISAIATAVAPRCNGAPIATQDFPRRIRSRLYLPITIDPEYHYEAINVENQQKNLSSLLWWMRRVIAMRKKLQGLFPRLARIFVPENPKVLAFLRRTDDETILVVVNLSRFAQPWNSILRNFPAVFRWKSLAAIDFPPSEDRVIFLRFGPHAHYWFVLQSPSAATRARKRMKTPTIASVPGFSELLSGSSRRDLDAHDSSELPHWLPMVWRESAHDSGTPNRGRSPDFVPPGWRAPCPH